jgi:hypothetical protein
MQALDEMERLKAADPVTTTPEVPDFERAVWARVEAGATGGGPRRRHRWTRRVVAVAALGVALAVAVPTLLLHSEEGSVDVLAAGAHAVAAADGQTLRLAYDVVQTQDGQQTYSEHQEIASDPSSGRYLTVVTIRDRRIETAWDGSSFLRWTSTRPDVVQKTDGGPVGHKDAAPDGQVGLLRFMYETHRLSVTGEREANGAKQWVLSGTVAPETTMTAILNADTFVPEEIQRASADASGARTVLTTRYTEFSQSSEPVPEGLPGREGLRVVTTTPGG